jgi:hypothetical protein
MARGEDLRDAALAQVLENADEDFKAHVYDLIRGLPADWIGTGEDIRKMAMVQPHSPNAWGAVINTGIRRGWLAHTGEYRKMRQASSHARETRVYVRTETP